MSYRMIVLDLDGTLTNSQKIITERTKQKLFEAQDRGVKVVLASGRPTYGVTALANELKLEQYGGYILSFNGGQIINCKTKEVVFQRTIPGEMIPKLIDLAKRYHVDFLTYEDGTILTNNQNCPYAKIEAKINHMPMAEVENPKENICFPVPKMLMLGDGDYMATVEPKIQDTP